MSLLNSMLGLGVNIVKTPIKAVEDVLGGSVPEKTVDSLEDVVESGLDCVDDFFSGDWL